jgi:hypothetical protein
MINTDTPYKLAEIIRDTWPQIYILENKKFDKNKKNEPPQNIQTNI